MEDEFNLLPEEEQREKLKQMTAEELRRLISIGHPGEKGEPYSGFEVMEEIQRRGNQIFIDLNWPSTSDAIYKNKYTGSEEPLIDIVFSSCHPISDKFKEQRAAQSWAVLEHWWPKDLFKDDELFDEYNPRKNQTSLMVFMEKTNGEFK